MHCWCPGIPRNDFQDKMQYLKILPFSRHMTQNSRSNLVQDGAGWSRLSHKQDRWFVQDIYLMTSCRFSGKCLHAENGHQQRLTHPSVPKFQLSHVLAANGECFAPLCTITNEIVSLHPAPGKFENYCAILVKSELRFDDLWLSLWRHYFMNFHII